GMALETPTGGWVDANDRLCEIFGYTREELFKKHWTELTHPEDVAKDSDQLGKLLRGEIERYSIEKRFIRKDGRVIDAIIAINSTRDQDGKADLVFGFVVDITERKKAEEANSRLAAIVESSDDAIIGETLDGVITSWNRGAERLYGYSAEEVNGRSISILIPSDQPEELEQVFAKIGKGELVQHYETRRKRKDGTIIDVSLTLSPVKDRAGRIVGASSIARDVTQRKRLEDEVRRYAEHLEEMIGERSEKLAKSEARYRRLFESSPVALFEEDFSEVKRYLDELRSKGINDVRKHFFEHPDELVKCASMVKVTDVNETTLEMYGAKSIEEMRGELRRVFTAEFQDRFTEELVALGDGETRFASEFDNQTLKGDTKHVSLLLNVVPGYEDTLAKVLVAIIDITERKKMEQRLQQAERLAVIGETAAMVGHDLRNPLQGMAGALHLLKQEGLSEIERNEVVQVMERSLEYADSILRDLADYSARIQLSLSDVTPKSIITGAIGAVKVPPNVVVQNLSEDQPTLRGDVSRLRRAFVNLIENAIDAMPEGGKLTLNSRQLDGMVEISLSDTGSGIAENVAANLWKPFHTTKAKGLGLGLSISKRIVDAHGGKMSVESKAGEGTTITTCLPIEQENGR
ncbi:MAG TPA: PAS domain S-box protein, partial [archaeon]|nr:PAS domain S-box protein [archaeon]